VEIAARVVGQSLDEKTHQRLIDELLGERAHPTTATLVGFLVDAGQARRIGAIAEELAKEAAHRSERTLAEVRVAVPLSDAKKSLLADALERATGHPVELKIDVDPAVIGGVVARVGDEVFDGSLASRLTEAKQYLTGSV